MTPSTSHRLLESIRLAMEQSDLLNTLASVHAWAEEGVSLVQGVATRRLTEDEIGRLSVQGNRSDDWSLVEVGPGEVYLDTRCGTYAMKHEWLRLARFKLQWLDAGRKPTGESDTQ